MERFDKDRLSFIKRKRFCCTNISKKEIHLSTFNANFQNFYISVSKMQRHVTAPVSVHFMYFVRKNEEPSEYKYTESTIQSCALHI
jgi:hypothetical protein